MPVKKHGDRKHNTDAENRSHIPTKKNVHKSRLKITQTGKQLQEHRVTSLATAKKKKRPK